LQLEVELQKINQLICYILLFLCFLAAKPAKADLLSATLLYNQQEYKKAYEEFYRLAQLGNKDAIFNLGVMALHGQGMNKDLELAYAWFKVAGDFGLVDAEQAAQLILQTESDSDKLNAVYQQTLNIISYEEFRAKLRPIFNAEQFATTKTKPPLRTYTVDPKYPKEAYEKGIEGWVWLEFDVDETGNVKDVDIVDAFPDKTFNRAIINAVKRWRYEPYKVDGKAKTYHNRSLLYHFTTFKGERYQASFARQKKEYQKKINQLIEGAEQGNALVQYYIANWLIADEHNATKLLRTHWQDEHAGSELLLQSAKNGYANSQYRLGANLLRGEFALADREKGLNWLLYAAQSGLSFAQYRLARELLDEQHVEFDVDKAKRWLQQAADQGHFRAIRDLVALMFEQKEFTLAKFYLEKGLVINDEHPDLLKYKLALN